MRLLKIHGIGDARLDPYERPAAGPKDVVVRMTACGICGSDLSYINIGRIPTPGTITALGHEGAGEVLEVGAEVKDISVGQSVIINPMMSPGNIGSGGPEGAFTEELLVREARLGDSILPIPEGISYEIAAMCEPLAVAMHGVNRMAVKSGDKVVVFGCGPIGLGMILWLVDRGVTDVVALDLAPQRRERALALGARTALDPTGIDLRTELAKLHGEVPSYGRVGVGTDAVNSYTRLSTSRIDRFFGFAPTIVASDVRFIASAPSPAIANTCSLGRTAASPSATDVARPIGPDT